jgi:5-formyltetrahydrofolate cyclo-ligase
MTTKSSVRQQLLKARQLLTLDQKAEAGQSIAATLFATAEWKSARSVGCYLALPGEVATMSIVQTGLSEGKLMSAPVVLGKSEPMKFFRLTAHQILEQGPMGIWQPPQDYPMAPEKIDLLIVPGVGFDRAGFRIGYGGGFYDHFLAHYHGTTLGLGFNCQIVETLPTHAHDRPIQILVTETQFLRFSKRG